MGGTRMQSMTKERRGRRTGIVRLLALVVACGTLLSVTVTAEAAPAPPYQGDPTRKPQCGGQTKLVNQYAVKDWFNRYGYWQCTLTEDFDNSGLNPELWTVQTTAASGFGQGGECFVNNPENVGVSNGLLYLAVTKQAAPFQCQRPNGTSFTSQHQAGSIMTYQKFTQAYGRFEIRAKMPATTAPGLQFAYWLWPANAQKYGPTWPMSGEIDVMEWYSKYPDRGIPFLHYWDTTPSDPNITNNYCVIGDMSQWHTYTLEWSPQAIKILYDGNVCLLNTNWTPENGITKPAPFDHPFMVSLTQALGVLGTTNAVNPSTPGRAVAMVDYLYVWI